MSESRKGGDTSAHNWDLLDSCNTVGGFICLDRPRVDGGHRDFLRSVSDNGGHNNSWFDDTKRVCGECWAPANSLYTVWRRHHDRGRSFE